MAPSKPDKLFTPSRAIAQDNRATAQGNEAPSGPDSATSGSPSLDPGLTPVPKLTLALKPALTIIYLEADL